MKACVICKKQIPQSKLYLATCGGPKCREEYKTWAIANFDLLPDENKQKRKYENKFWEITPEQKEYHDRFFEMVIPKKPVKKRNCLRCRKQLASNKMGTSDGRICNDCHIVISHLGALACV